MRSGWNDFAVNPLILYIYTYRKFKAKRLLILQDEDQSR